MLDEFLEGALDGCGAVIGLGLAFVIAGILASLLVNPFIGVGVGALAIFGALARLVQHARSNPAVRSAGPG